jgi:hypothetical protein
MKTRWTVMMAALLAANCLYAEIWTGNLDSTADNFWGLDSITVAAGFTTGNDQVSYDVNQLTIRVESGAAPSGTVSFSIFSNDGSEPGSALSGTAFTLSGAAAGADATIENGSYTLAASTTYWLVGSREGVADLDWSNVMTGNMVQEGWSIEANAKYFSGSDPDASSTWGSWANIPIFELGVVPEPATALSLVLGGALFGFYRRFFGRV